MAKLTTTKAVINALGGVKKVAQLTTADYNAAWNWTTWETFPADTYDVMIKALAAKGHSAPSTLWRQRQRPTKLQMEAQAG